MLVMPRKKTKTLTSIRINTQLLERLDHIADRVGRTRSDIIDRAIEEYVEREEVHATRPADSKASPKR